MQDLHRALLVLATIQGLGGQAREETARALLDPAQQSGVLDALVNGRPDGLPGWSNHPTAEAELRGFDAHSRADTIAQRCVRIGAGMLFRGESDYPRRLDDLEHAPLVLYWRGAADALEEGAGWVAMVGTRKPSGLGRRFARRSAAELASAGLTVVSGLALGTDAAVHEGALDAAGRTVAVLASGVDEFTPRTNADLGHRMMERGAVVSEHPPGTRVAAWAFADRNRVIAALAAVTVVLEAGLSSGTTLTAEAALELGRPLYVMPGRPGDAATAGGLELLARGGVKLFRGSQDVFDEYPRIARRASSIGAELLKLARLMAEHLPCNLDDLVKRLELQEQLPVLLGSINLLKMHGLLHEDGAGHLHLVGELPDPAETVRYTQVE